MRFLLLAFTTSVALMAPASARADDPAPNADPEAAPLPPEDAKAAAKVKAEQAKEDPKLPNAGSSIKISLPQKNEGSSLLWKPRWRKFSDAEYVVTSVSIAITVGTLFVPPRPTAWNTGGILFDESVRNALRPRSTGWRLNLRDTSDVLLSIASTYPFLIDALAVAWWHRGSTVVATQMALMNAEAMAITAAIQGMVSAFVSRERPYGASGHDCVEGVQTEDCIRSNRYRSFFSGHTSQAFVSAALTCAHHGNLPLYGTVAGDTTACVTGVAVAATIGTLRIVSDMHYASDVITGAVLGSLVGLGVPYLFHYRGRAETAASRKSPWPTMMLTPMPTGLAVTGIFG
jgi:membrane-associated phospholipid phosphatase